MSRLSLRRAALLALCVLLGLSSRLAAQDAGAADAEVPEAIVVLDAPTQPAAEQAAAEQPKKKTGKKKRKKKRAKRPKRVQREDGFHLRTSTRASGGTMLGLRERQDDFAFVRGAVGVDPSFRAGDLQLTLPLDLVRREAIGASLSETRASTAFGASYRFARAFRASAFAGFRFVDRSSWPDLRQPAPDGSHYGTDRYSYGARRAGGEVTVHPAKRHWLRSSYEYRLADYVTDPNFEAVAHPTHLAPFDHEKHIGDVDYHYSTRGLRVGAGASGFVKNNFFWFSRDANTGFTHASPGGRPANPLQVLRRFTPRADLKVELADKRLELMLRYAHEFQEDPYQGYYTFSGPNPRMELRVRALDALWLQASAELWWRRYGAGSYRAGIGHPELDDGNRRYDHRFGTELLAELELSKPFILTLEGAYLTRKTNFPDYEPGVFPPRRNYSIDWDYGNWRVELGLQARVDWL